MGVQIQGDTGNVIATKGTYSGNVTIGGTLTYEDVTNIDSVGLITAREGIEVGARPGVGASISVDGNAIFSGITTATTIRSTTGIVTTLTATGLTVDSGTTNTCATFKSTDAGAVINLTDSAARSSIEQNDTALKIIADTDASDADSKIQFQVDASTKATIDSTGDLTISDGDLVIGTAGHGIDFSAQTASSLSGVTVSSEILDHYEEGTFTPTFGASNGSSTAGYSTQSGKYTRIGNIVHVQIRITLSSLVTNSHSHAWISGLPIAAAERTTTSAIISGGLQGSGYTGFPIVGRTEANATRIELFAATNGGVTDYGTGDISGTASFILACTYRAA